MSALAIMKKAYAEGIVPTQLYGKAQHKTLQARLSEDILDRREHSPFFRTKPGTFFLREFLTDVTIPGEHRQEMTARRRTRDLLRGPALSIDIAAIRLCFGEHRFWDARAALSMIRDRGWYSYIDPKNADDDRPLLWAFSAVMKDRKVLSYRAGRYRDNRDHFAHKRSIGFTTLIQEEDRNLFDVFTFGIADKALEAVATDLDLPLTQPVSEADAFRHSIKFLTSSNGGLRATVLAFIEVKAPSWFEPSANKLSLNDLRWLDLDVPPNNLEDFDPWSKELLSHYFDKGYPYG
jgi:hypothetical protein